MHRYVFVTMVSFALAACGLTGGAPEPAKPDSVIRGVNFIGVTVDDLDAAEAYYKAGVEAETIADSPIEAGTVLAELAMGDGTAQTRLIRRTNAQLRLMAFSSRPEASKQIGVVPVQGPGIAHVCFQVAEETDSYNRILKAGAKHIGHRDLVHLSDDNPVGYGYVTDPSGIITEIEQVDLAKLNLPQTPKNTRRVRHVSLATPNLERLMDFYSAFLGGQEPRHVGSWINVSGETVDKVSGLKDSKIEMAWFQLRNLEIEMFQYHSHPTKLPAKPRPVDAPGYNMIVFDVADIASARKRLVDAGGTIVSKVGTLDGGQILFGRDPDGNLIGLQKLPASSAFSAANFPDNGT